MDGLDKTLNVLVEHKRIKNKTRNPVKFCQIQENQENPQQALIKAGACGRIRWSASRCKGWLVACENVRRQMQALMQELVQALVQAL